MSLSALKKNQAAALEKLKAKTQESQTSERTRDDRFWKPTFDKEAGVGSAVIRFLPAVEGEDLPWVKIIKHNFKGPTGKYYNEMSRRNIGEADPCGALNNRLWNSGIESDKDVARGMKQKIEYIANVLVIKDAANPENEGQVKLYRFGPMIFNMIQEQLFPKFDGDEAMDPFNPWHGANFNIKIVGKQVGKDLVPNYEKSVFAAPAALFGGDDDEIEATYAKCQPLKPFIAPELVKSEEELKRKLFEVLGPTVGSGVQTVEGWSAPEEQKPVPRRTPRPVEADEEDAPAPKATPAKAASKAPVDDDDDDAFLRSLMED